MTGGTPMTMDTSISPVLAGPHRAGLRCAASGELLLGRGLFAAARRAGGLAGVKGVSIKTLVTILEQPWLGKEIESITPKSTIFSWFV